MLEINSKDNDKIKLLTAVRDSASARREYGLCFAEGLRLCRDAAGSGRVKNLFITRESMESHPEIAGWGVPIVIVEGAAAKKIGDTKNGQNIFALCDTGGLMCDTEELPEKKYLFLDGISDPGNMGTMIRTAEAFALGGVILYGGCDPFSPKAVRAGMGGVFRLKLYSCQDSERMFAGLKNRGFYLAAGVAEQNAACARHAPESGGAVLCIGSEAGGISEKTAQYCEKITIKMKGAAESPTAASAASILLWELFGRDYQ